MSTSSRRLACALLLGCTALSSAAVADEWVVDRLRGELLAQQGGVWVALARGDTVDERQTVRTGETARVVLTRGNQSIEIDGASEIVIHERDAGQMTMVQQAYGSVTIEAERREIQHFSVVTPFLAAIVKGTRFTVESGEAESSVEVWRGLVQVQDNVHSVATDVAPGQSAVAGSTAVLEVSGAGRTVPLVTLQGQIITPEQEALIRKGSSVEEALTARPAAASGADVSRPGQSNGKGNSSLGNSGQANNGNGNGNSGKHGNSGQGNSGNGNSDNSGHNGSGNSAMGNSDNGSNAGDNGNGRGPSLR